MTLPMETVKFFYEALARGDAPAALGLLTPDMEWSVVAGWPYKPTGRGPQAVAEGVLMPVLKEWRDYNLHGSDMFEAPGGKVVSVGIMTASTPRPASRLKRPTSTSGRRQTVGSYECARP
jgi:uncharacterized protein